MEEIELKDLFYMVLNKLWLIILLIVLSAVVSGVISIFYLTPEYETSTTMMLGKPADYGSTDGITYQDIQVNQKLIGTYAEIAKSKVVLNEVKESLGTSLSSTDIGKKINVSLVNGTEIIKVTVKDTSPERAVSIANTVSSVFMKNVSDIMQIDNVQVIDVAEEPMNPVSPNIKMNIAIAGVLGAMIALFIIFVIEAFDNTIKVPEDVTRHLSLPVIGMIPDHD
jgi:capsular polysaccharide biosynthesis protein